MHLRLIREPSDARTTLGVLFVNSRFFSFTLEDRVREVPGQPVEAWKVKHQTAIPVGTYRVRLTWSTRFKRVLPLLDDVPGFTGIRIHPGNTHEDTSGCILLGAQRASARVTSSRVACEALQAEMSSAIGRGEPVDITIEPADMTPAAAPTDTRAV